MSFWYGFLAGAIFTMALFAAMITLMYWMRRPRWKKMEEFTKRGDEIIAAGENPTTWTSEEKKEAWMAERAQWQKEVREWEQKGK